MDMDVMELIKVSCCCDMKEDMSQEPRSHEGTCSCNNKMVNLIDRPAIRLVHDRT